MASQNCARRAVHEIAGLGKACQPTRGDMRNRDEAGTIQPGAGGDDVVADGRVYDARSRVVLEAQVVADARLREVRAGVVLLDQVMRRGVVS